eukprot:793302-Prorocentrum_minimum.AAC.3
MGRRSAAVACSKRKGSLSPCEHSTPPSLPPKVRTYQIRRHRQLANRIAPSLTLTLPGLAPTPGRISGPAGFQERSELPAGGPGKEAAQRQGNSL